MYLPLCQFSKKNLIRYVLGKVSNFDLIFYVIRTLHKKTRQSLWPSLGRIGWDFFSKIGIEVGTYFVKKAPNFEIVWPTSATPRALNVKGVYEVSYSCYGQINGTVCRYCWWNLEPGSNLIFTKKIDVVTWIWKLGPVSFGQGNADLYLECDNKITYHSLTVSSCNLEQ